jgi:hypothetical protein
VFLLKALSKLLKLPLVGLPHEDEEFIFKRFVERPAEAEFFHVSPNLGVRDGNLRHTKVASLVDSVGETELGIMFQPYKVGSPTYIHGGVYQSKVIGIAVSSCISDSAAWHTNLSDAISAAVADCTPKDYFHLIWHFVH